MKNVNTNIISKVSQMKKLYFILLILGLAIHSDAQSQKKNEIQIGLTASYFNYGKTLKWHSLESTPLLTIVYWRKTNIGKFGLEAERLFFDYEKKKYQPGDVMHRNYNQFQLLYSYDDFKLNLLSLEITFLGSLCYRSGVESISPGTSTFFNIYGNNLYNDFGVSVGIQTKTKSFHHFYLASDIRYFKYFSPYSSTLFQINVILGYEF